MTAARSKRPGRQPRTPNRRGSLDQVLIEAAMDLFASYGYRGTSLARIARAAGVTKGALYWHFADKEEFFLAVLDKVMAEWAPVFDSAPTNSSTRAGYKREFLRMFDTLADLNQKNPWVSRLLLIITLESSKIGPRVLGAMRSANLIGLNRMQHVIERGKRLSVLDPELDARWAATRIFASYLGLAMLWYLHGSEFSLRTSLRRRAREFLDGWSAVQ